MIRIIDRLILRIFFSYFFVILLGISVAIFVFDSLDSLINNPDLLQVAKNSLQLLPPTIELITPYVGLLSTMLTFGALYKHSEIISMKSAGLSQLQIIRSIIAVSLLIAGFLYINQSYLIRYFNAEAKVITLSSRDTHSDWYQTSGKIIQIQEPQLLFNSIKKIEAIDFDFDANVISRQEFDDIKFVGKDWIASDTTMSRFYDDSVVQVSHQNHPISDLDLEQLIKSPIYPSNYQTIKQLYDSWRYSKRGQFVSRLSLLLLLRKFSYLLNFVLLILLAVVFSESKPRSHKNTLKIVTVTIIFYCFWFFDQLFYLLAKEGTIDIFSGAFAMNLVLLSIVGYYLKFKKI